MKNKKPRPFTVVKFVGEINEGYPFTTMDTFIYHNEIQNMPGHCVVSNMATGQVYSGYHCENFTELSEIEL